MKIATEYPGQTAIRAVTQQRHFHVSVLRSVGNQGQSLLSATMEPILSLPKVLLIPASGLSAQLERLVLVNFDSFPGSQLFSHYTSPSWRAVSVVTRSAEQKPKGRGCKPIPGPGQSSRRWAGGWRREWPCKGRAAQNGPGGGIGGLAYQPSTL